MINTGFIMSSSINHGTETKKKVRRTQIFTNERTNLLFEKIQDRENGSKHKFYTSGMLFRTFSQLDLCELDNINSLLNARTKLNEID